MSFLVIGIIWVNHHAMFTLVRRVDRRVLFANLALLLVVSLIPFPTRILSEYLTADAAADAHFATVVYSATMLAMSLAFSGLWLAVTRDARLLHEEVDPATRRTTLRRFGVGMVAYAATIGIALISAVAALAVHSVLALYYCFDQLTVAERRARSDPGQPAGGGPRDGGSTLRGST